MKIKADGTVMEQTCSGSPGGRNMLRNIATIDRVILHGILGLAFVALAARDGIPVATVVCSATAAVYLLATAIFPYCPIYAVLGLSTFGRLDRSA
jgi:hypothetical protein